jgi:phosphoribosylformylglycinamidine synthase I
VNAVAAPNRARRARRTGGPRALVLRAPGTNCDRETMLALELAGASPETLHVERLLQDASLVDEFALLVLPGGFSYGDHLGAGTLWAHRMDALGEPLHRFVETGRPLLGICNGFQALMRLGLLHGGALAPNASGHFECRWVWMRRPEMVRTPFLEGIERIAMPIGHGEGRFVAANAETLGALHQRGNAALVYCDGAGEPGPYPINPNGSEGDVAALTNEQGNVLGIMPHPERNIGTGLAPQGRQDDAGLALFVNAVRMAKG